MAFSILYIHTIPQIDSHIQSLTTDSESVVLYINSEVNNASVQPLTKKKSNNSSSITSERILDKKSKGSEPSDRCGVVRQEEVRRFTGGGGGGGSDLWWPSL